MKCLELYRSNILTLSLARIKRQSKIETKEIAIKHEEEERLELVNITHYPDALRREAVNFLKACLTHHGGTTPLSQLLEESETTFSSSPEYSNYLRLLVLGRYCIPKFESYFLDEQLAIKETEAYFETRCFFGRDYMVRRPQLEKKDE